MEYTLRDYQTEAVNSAITFFTNKKKIGKAEIICAPTASGKSLMIGNTAKVLREYKENANMLVMQPSSEILHQNKEKLESYGFKPTIYSASGGDKKVSNLTLATIGSVVNKVELFDKVTHILWDEVHLINAKGGMHKDFLDGLQSVHLLGYSATPWRMSSNSWGTCSKILTRTRPKIFNNFNYIIQNKKLWNDGYLCPIDYCFVSDYDSRQIQLNTTGMNFDQESLIAYNKSQNLTKIISDVIDEFRDRKRIVVFTTFVDEAETIAEELDRMGISAEAISSRETDTNRKRILADFRSGKIKVVINAKLLTIGYDFPAIDCIIDGAPTLSLALNSQKIGRGVRLCEGKESLLYFDVVHNSRIHGNVSQYELLDIPDRGWTMCCGNKYLTGMDLATGDDLRIRKPKIVNAYDTIHFGQYTGKKLSDKDVPINFIKFIVDKFDSGRIKAAFELELKNRTTNNILLK